MPKVEKQERSVENELQFVYRNVTLNTDLRVGTIKKG